MGWCTAATRSSEYSIVILKDTDICKINSKQTMYCEVLEMHWSDRDYCLVYCNGSNRPQITTEVKQIGDEQMHANYEMTSYLNFLPL